MTSMVLKTCLLLSILFTCSASWGQDTLSCTKTDIGYIKFRSNSKRLTLTTKKKLDSLVLLLNDHPGCRVVVTTHAAHRCEKCNALNWDRMEAMARYLAKYRQRDDQISFYFDFDGHPNRIHLSLTPSINPDEAPPRPHLIRP
ncbi:MAG: hypothetical protein ABW019_17185 [Chitinophagaceae bacterium]